MKEASEQDNAVEAIVRGKKILQLDPVEVSADPKYNGRFAPPSKSETKEMADSIRTHGQIQPVIVTRSGKEYRMVLGFTRQAAVQFLNESLADGEEPYKLEAVEISGADAVTLLELNTEENIRRKNLSPMDKAHAISMFDEAGKSDKEIAGIMGFKSHASVIQHRKLLNLDKGTQKRVHVGEIAADAAFDLAKLAPEEQKEVLKEVAPKEAEVSEKTGKAVKKVKSSAVRKAVEKKGGFAAGIRKMPELRKFLGVIRADSTLPSNASFLADILLVFIEKSANESKVLKAFREGCTEDEITRKALVKKGVYSKTAEEKAADQEAKDAIIAEQKAEAKAKNDKAKAKAAAKKEAA